MFDNELRVKGPISIKSQAASESPRDGSIKYAIILMGPTGAGKSSFIEALSGNTSLGISKDQLDGYTQDVCAYHLEGVVLMEGNSTKEWPLVLFDTPGFADRKISEMDIVTKITRYLSSCGISAMIYALLYLVPITDLRLSGTRRRVMNTFQTMVGDMGAHRVTVVTTMWNTIHRDEAKEKADARYEELRNGPWKEVLNLGAQMTKFLDTTQESALAVLKTALEEPNCSDFSFPFFESVHKEKFSPKTPFLPNLVSDLESGIDALQSEDKRLTEEIAQAEKDGEDLLVSVLEENLKDIQPHLVRFTQQLRDLRAAVDEERSSTPFDYSFISDDNRFKHRHSWPTVFYYGVDDNHQVAGFKSRTTNANPIMELGQQTGLINEDDVSSDFVHWVARRQDEITRQEIGMRFRSLTHAKSRRDLPHRNNYDPVSISRWIMGPHGDWVEREAEV